MTLQLVGPIDLGIRRVSESRIFARALSSCFRGVRVPYIIIMCK